MMRDPLQQPFRWAGLFLLAVLLWWAGLPAVGRTLGQATLAPVVAAVALNVPQIFLKAARWWTFLQAQRVPYGIGPATLSYFGSMFIGLLTPGRLGEFVKAQHVRKDMNISMGIALSSVLVDRFLDFCVLSAVGVLALAGLAPGGSALGQAAVAGLLMAAGAATTAAFLHDASFGWGAGVLHRVSGARATRLLRLAEDMRGGIKELSGATLGTGLLLTLASYLLFFTQCYLLARALRLPVGPVDVGYAVTLGSLVTLLPLSISGLGTREATIVAYLGRAGIPADIGLSFAILVFLTFYVGGAVLGALAWMVKPVPSWR